MIQTDHPTTLSPPPPGRGRCARCERPARVRLASEGALCDRCAFKVVEVAEERPVGLVSVLSRALRLS